MSHSFSFKRSKEAVTDFRSGVQLGTQTFLVRLQALLLRGYNAFCAARQRHRQRQWLSQMSMRELQDMGASLADAQEELRKPFWKE